MAIMVIGARASGMAAGDAHILPRNPDAANRFIAPPVEEEMHAMVTRLDMQLLFT